MIWWTLRQSRSTDPQVRATSLLRLRGSSDAKVVIRLTEAIKDDVRDVRKAAIIALADCDHTDAVEALLGLTLLWNDEEIAAAAVAALSTPLHVNTLIN